MKFPVCSLLFLLAACGGSVDGSSDAAPAVHSAPAVIVGGFIDPPAESPASHDLEVSDGDVSYRVMFALDSGQGIVDRINAVTGATIQAGMTPGGYLYLQSVESGTDARILVLRGAALPMLGLEERPSATGE